MKRLLSRARKSRTNTPKSVAERVLRKYQERIIAETAEIFDLREEIGKAEPHTEHFRQKIHELSWKYTASLKTIDMANLSQLVVRRAAIVEILALACDRQLAVQAVKEGDHIGDLSEYAHLLAAKSNGRLKKFYGYLIGDTIAPLRMAGWTRFAAGKGYFRSTPLEDPESGRNLGELYAETLFFEDIVKRASQRIGIYREKLRIDLSKK